MKIINKKKFTRMVFIMIGVITFIFFVFSNTSLSKGEVKEKIIYISNGDTLWSIASDEKETNAYYEQKDIRDIVYDIKKMNNLENNNTLVIGQKLVINSL